MPNENKELTHCPNCPRHCPKEALSCERGIRFFDQDEPGDSGFGRGMVTTPSITAVQDSLKVKARIHWS